MKYTEKDIIKDLKDPRAIPGVKVFTGPKNDRKYALRIANEGSVNPHEYLGPTSSGYFEVKDGYWGEDDYGSFFIPEPFKATYIIVAKD